MYLNHKPVFPLTQDDIEISLSNAKRLEPGKPIPLGSAPRLKNNQTVRAEGLMSLLGQYGTGLYIWLILKLI